MNQNNEIVKIFMFRNFNIFVETHCEYVMKMLIQQRDACNASLY